MIDFTDKFDSPSFTGFRALVTFWVTVSEGGAISLNRPSAKPGISSVRQIRSGLSEVQLPAEFESK